jgi:hypothetical protein
LSPVEFGERHGKSFIPTSGTRVALPEPQHVPGHRGYGGRRRGDRIGHIPHALERRGRSADSGRDDHGLDFHRTPHPGRRADQRRGGRPVQRGGRPVRVLPRFIQGPDGIPLRMDDLHGLSNRDHSGHRRGVRQIHGELYSPSPPVPGIRGLESSPGRKHPTPARFRRHPRRDGRNYCHCQETFGYHLPNIEKRDWIFEDFQNFVLQS